LDGRCAEEDDRHVLVVVFQVLPGECIMSLNSKG
jgi:hypothetical protein